MENSSRYFVVCSYHIEVCGCVEIFVTVQPKDELLQIFRKSYSMWLLKIARYDKLSMGKQGSVHAVEIDMNVLIMSDIHGNIDALERILERVGSYDVQGCILLGDLIDYGMHSNEVIERLQKLEYPVLCNIWGNHEDAIINENYSRFSSDRGRGSARNTHRCLKESAWEYLKGMTCSGKSEFECGGKKCLAIHGSKDDYYWKSISPEQNLAEYGEYDYVFSGHSHRAHYFERYYAAQDIKRRNEKKTIFINPGSVGQPRNLNPLAQAAVLNPETEEIYFIKAQYDIKKEQAAFTGEVDSFYRDRLEYGV